MTREQILKKLNQIKPLYEKEGLSIVGLFGSFAKDSSDLFSDIDIAYRIDHQLFSHKFKDGFSKILRIADIKSELESTFKRRVDFISLNSSNSQFTDRVQKDMIYV